MKNSCRLVVRVFVLAFTIPTNCLADRVYRCYQNGTLTFTEIATDRSCQGMDVKPYQPDPDTVARQKNELKQWQERRKSVLDSPSRKKRNASEANGAAGNPQSRGEPESGKAGGQNPELPGALQFQTQDMPR